MFSSRPQPEVAHCMGQRVRLFFVRGVGSKAEDMACGIHRSAAPWSPK